MSVNSVLWSVKDAETSLRYESLNRVNVKRTDVKKTSLVFKMLKCS